MNKLLKGLLIIALAFTFVITSVSADEKDPQVISENTNETTKSKVNLYLFRKAGCHYCANELVYLDKIINKYNKKINIITYDILEGNNSKLLDDVAASLKHDVRGVPFTVVGDKFLEGFGEGLESDLIKLIENGYDNQVEDLVASILDENIYSNLVKTDLYEAMKKEDLKITSRKEKQNNLIPIIVFGSIIVGVGALIYYSRKK